MFVACSSCRHLVAHRGSCIIARKWTLGASYVTERDAIPESGQALEPEQSFFLNDSDDASVGHAPKGNQLLKQIWRVDSPVNDIPPEKLFDSVRRVPQLTQETLSGGSGPRPRLSRSPLGFKQSKEPFGATDITKKLDRLEQLLLAPPAVLWKDFVDGLGAGKDGLRLYAASVNGGAERQRGLFGAMLKRLVSAWCQSDARDLPSPTQVRSRFEALGIMHHTYWEEMTWRILLPVFRQDKGEQALRRSNDELSQELVTFWRDCFKQFAVKMYRDSSSSQEWTTIPDLKGLQRMVQRQGQTSEFYDRFFQFLGRYPASRQKKASTLPAGALLSFEVLGRRRDPTVPDTADAGRFPFLRLIATIAFRSKRFAEVTLAKRVLAQHGIGPDTSAEVERNFQALANTINRFVAFKFSDDTDATGMPADQEASLQRNMVMMWQKRLARIEDHRDAPRLHRLWRQTRHEFTREGADSFLHDIPVDVCEAFIRASVKLHQNDLAIKIWNAMIASGRIPRVQTWTALIYGAYRVHDPEAIENVWRKMLDYGVRPNAVAWGVRIFGLINCQEVLRGIAALDEMGQAWRRAAKKHLGSQDNRIVTSSSVPDIPGFARPDLNVVNVAVSALLRLRDRKKNQYVSKVLAWAKAYGIEPNVATYNNFILAAVRRRDMREVADLLQRMEARQIRPDAYTFSILLTARFRNAPSVPQTEAQLVAWVTGVLQDLERHGLKANDHHYGILIHGLLTTHRNESAARAVLAYMSARGIEPSPHIYTILADHYFRQDPPDTDGVAALCARLANRTTLHGTAGMFYNRVIAGYADLGDVGTMMAMLTQMVKDGRQPGWRTLSAVVQALSGAGEHGQAQSIVHDVRHGVGLTRLGVQGSEQQKRRFWDTVDALRFDAAGDQRPRTAARQLHDEDHPDWGDVMGSGDGDGVMSVNDILPAEFDDFPADQREGLRSDAAYPAA